MAHPRVAAEVRGCLQEDRGQDGQGGLPQPPHREIRGRQQCARGGSVGRALVDHHLASGLELHAADRLGKAAGGPALVGAASTGMDHEERARGVDTEARQRPPRFRTPRIRQAERQERRGSRDAAGLDRLDEVFPDADRGLRRRNRGGHHDLLPELAQARRKGLGAGPEPRDHSGEAGQPAPDVRGHGITTEEGLEPEPIEGLAGPDDARPGEERAEVRLPRKGRRGPPAELPEHGQRGDGLQDVAESPRMDNERCVHARRCARVDRRRAVEVPVRSGGVRRRALRPREGPVARSRS